MKQSAATSLIEAVINTLVGFGIGLAAQWFFLPLLGVVVDFRQNVIFACIMTVISIARAFGMRRLFEALHIRRPLSPAMQAVIAERFRQIEMEGWSASHDDAHAPGELARAGASYALWDGAPWLLTVSNGVWPWAPEWFKPQDIRRNLVRGAALMLAEIDRHDRARKRAPSRVD